MEKRKIVVTEMASLLAPPLLGKPNNIYCPNYIDGHRLDYWCCRYHPSSG
jgi:hypothetical protein